VLPRPGGQGKALRLTEVRELWLAKKRAEAIQAVPLVREAGASANDG
jgi:hypothetical protein